MASASRASGAHGESQRPLVSQHRRNGGAVGGGRPGHHPAFDVVCRAAERPGQARAGAAAVPPGSERVVGVSHPLERVGQGPGVCGLPGSALAHPGAARLIRTRQLIRWLRHIKPASHPSAPAAAVDAPQGRAPPLPM
ncbi:hypothetical protein G6F63_014578 [Rhizopus arrhizus]|nr:hypothetical protein G6F63_014578 [Rhizopus arrhizus]